MNQITTETERNRKITIQRWKSALVLYTVFFSIGFYFINFDIIDIPFNNFLVIVILVSIFQLLSFFTIKSRIFDQLEKASFTFSQLFVLNLGIIYIMSFLSHIHQAAIINLTFLGLLYGIFSFSRIHFILLTIIPIIGFAFFIGQNIYHGTLGIPTNIAILQWILISVLLVSCSTISNYISTLRLRLNENRKNLLVQKEDLQISHRELVSVLRQTAEKASRDELTGLYNRRYFSEILHTQISISMASESPLGLLILDIDHFKPVNDTYGHLAGDEILKSFNDIHKNCLRKSDFIARYGGEEFVILLPNADKDTLLGIGERIRNFVKNQVFDHIEKGFYITVSIGATHYVTGESSESLIKRADDNLYKAKNSGRNQLIYSLAIDSTTDSNTNIPLAKTLTG